MVMFRYYLLGSDTAPSGLYARLYHAFVDIDIFHLSRDTAVIGLTNFQSKLLKIITDFFSLRAVLYQDLLNRF